MFGNNGKYVVAVGQVNMTTSENQNKESSLLDGCWVKIIVITNANREVVTSEAFGNQEIKK